MKRRFNVFLSFALSMGFFVSCENYNSQTETVTTSFEKRITTISDFDSLESGTSYLSVYSQIYGKTEERIYDLTATVSLRNTSEKETLYIHSAEYFNTQGKLIKEYVSKSVEIRPLETIEIVIHENDAKRGTGANFIFDWSIDKSAPEPIFECVTKANGTVIYI